MTKHAPSPTLTPLLTGRKLVGAYVVAVGLYLFAVMEIVTIARGHGVMASPVPAWLRPFMAATYLMFAVRKTIHITLSELTRERAEQQAHDAPRRIP